MCEGDARVRYRANSLGSRLGLPRMTGSAIGEPLAAGVAVHAAANGCRGRQSAATLTLKSSITAKPEPPSRGRTWVWSDNRGCAGSWNG